MDYIFTPWRYAYVTSTGKATSCIFCDALSAGSDRAAWIVFRGRYSFIILNAFPYTSGHVMVVPYEHVDELHKLTADVAHEIMDLSRKIETVLREVYHPEGVNLGMNIGKAAGAGVAGHIHMHVLPRWTADSNFMTVVGETRVLPESLEITYDRLLPFFSKT
jgi:ATP adenylyltransferase